MTLSTEKQHLAGLRGAARPRDPPARPTYEMRERIAVALRGSQPNFFEWLPTEAYTLYLADQPALREMYEEWADRLLLHLDVLDLELINTLPDDEGATQTHERYRSVARKTMLLFRPVGEEPPR